MKLSKAKLITVPAAGIAIAGATILGAGAANAAGNSVHIHRLAKPQARYEARLDKAVTDGKLTSAQEAAILAEHNLLKNELKTTPKANRKTERQTIKTQAKAWAAQNNVNVSWLIRA